MHLINRSYLFVSGNRPECFLKAINSGAHAVIIDLEDGVALSEKDSVRKSVGEWLNSGQPVVLRINGAETQWFASDLALCSKPGVSAVMLAKAETSDQVRLVKDHVGVATAIMPQIESARGMANALEIAQCAGVQRLVFGSLDFQVDMGIEGDDTELLYFRSHLVLISKLAGVQPPVDTPSTAIDSPKLLRTTTERARRLGFGGKLCIHPKQVPIINASFLPSSDEVAWAKKVLDAAAATGGSAVALDGKMVDRPVILKAERVMVEAQRASSDGHAN
jgi:citrate lyase subunit beta/citryl-CoA lyase